MKKIECIIPQKKFQELEQKLREQGISGMTVTEVKGYGNQQTRPETYLLLPKTKIEIYCNDADLEGLLEVIVSQCKSAQMGSGKIAVYEIAELIRIRTGEKGTVAV